jgi:hypothetical protein
MSSLRFILSEHRHGHLLRHFGDNSPAGSHFNTAVFASPQELILFINSNAPISTQSYSEKKVAYLFRTTDGTAVGTDGLALRKSIPAEDIVQENRDGYSLSIGLIAELPITQEFCVIAYETPEGLSIVTAFPGGYARPFAQKGQPTKEYALNKQFWEDHVLVRKKG